MDNRPREEHEEKFQSESPPQQMVELYPQEEYHLPPPDHQSYYHMVYPESYSVEHLPPADRAYYDTAYPSDYYDPHRSYSYHYPSDYSSQYYPEYMTYSQSYREPAYPSKYHPSPPQPHITQSQSRHSERRNTGASIDKDEVDKKERKQKPFQSYMLWSVFNFIFCWGILGAIAMVNSFEARQKHKYGFDKDAKRHQRCALGLNIAGTIVGIAVTATVVVVLVMENGGMMENYSNH